MLTKSACMELKPNSLSTRTMCVLLLEALQRPKEYSGQILNFIEALQRKKKIFQDQCQIFTKSYSQSTHNYNANFYNTVWLPVDINLLA